MIAPVIEPRFARAHGALAEEQYASVDLADYVRVIRRRKWLILLVAVVVAVAAFGYSRTQPTKYTTGAQLQFVAPETETSASPRVVEAYAQDEASFLRSSTVATRAAEILKTDVEPRTLLKQLRVTATDSLVVTVRYTATSPRTAQRTAQAFAQAYIDLRRTRATDELKRLVAAKDSEIDDLEQRVERVSGQLESACSLSSENPALCTVITNNLFEVSGQLSDAQVERDNLESTPIDAGSIFSPAPLPKVPSTPGPVRTVALGGIIGLVLGICVAFVRDRLDQRVLDKSEIEATIGVVPLASIPMFDEAHRERARALVTVHAPDSAEADAFRRLRASVLIAAEAAEAQIIAITSANPGEGKSTVSSNLAVAISQAGQSVALVSTDIRRPSIEGLFGLPEGAGLGQVLEGLSSLDRALIRINHWLAVLPSGNVTKSNPSDLLTSPNMVAVLDTLKDQFAYVIVDTPPVLAVADTLGMVPRFDAVVIVVSLDQTTSTEVIDAEAQLQRVGANLIGAVVNRAAPNAQRYYSYQQRDSPS